MHFEVLIEDQSGKKFLEILLPRLISKEHSYKVHSYKGIGRIPKNINKNDDVSKRILLTQLPRLLKGYGKTFSKYPKECPASVVVVCDLDDKNLVEFLGELDTLLGRCCEKPLTRFCLAIEEGEAWFLGDIDAVLAAYPQAKKTVLNGYVNDSICGTWECLADAVYPGGAQSLLKGGWQAVGSEKSIWAAHITPHMNVDNNLSPSFSFFVKNIRALCELK